jgi:cytochrome b
MLDKAKILVWDLHTRLFHWLLLLVFVASMTTGLLGDIDLMTWHLRSGYALLGLLIFRLLTGLFGRDYGRFTRFALSPSAIFSYLRGERQFVGHNPLGSWMIVVMLLALIVQAFSGLMTSDDFFVEGPWVFWASEQWVSWSSLIHSNNYRLLLLLVGMHISAVLFYYFVRATNLVLPMISGYKHQQEKQSSAEAITVVRLLLLVGGAVLFAWLLVGLNFS